MDHFFGFCGHILGAQSLFLSFALRDHFWLDLVDHMRCRGSNPHLVRFKTSTLPLYVSAELFGEKPPPSLFSVVWVLGAASKEVRV